MRTATKVLVLAASLAASVPAMAAEPKAAPAVELARQVFTVEQYDATMAATAKVVVAQIVQSVVKGGGTVSPELEAAFLAGYRKLMPYQELLDLQAGILAKYFTPAELAELAAFYRTPTGRKALQVMPEAIQDAMGSSLAGNQAKMAELMEGLKPYIQAPAAK